MRVTISLITLLLSISAYPRDLAADRSSVVIASSDDFPPINMLDSHGELQGFGRELSDAVFASLGIQVNRLYAPIWGDVLDDLAEGRADLIHDAAYTKERTAYLEFSQPIVQMDEVIFVRSDQVDIHDFESLKGKKVACVDKHITHLYLQHFPEISCYVVHRPIEGVYALMSGDVDAYVYPREIVLYFMQKFGVSDQFKVVGEPLRTLYWSMAVKKGNTPMLNLINRGLDNVRASGEYQQIYQKWFGRKLFAGYTRREFQVFAALTAFAALLVGAALSLMWYNRRLRKTGNRLKFSQEQLNMVQSQLKIVHDELEQRVDQRTRDLAFANERLNSEIEVRQQAELLLIQAKAEAEQANRAKSEFLSRMSHELRTPLNAILGFAQLMKMEREAVTERQRASLDEILTSGRHLLMLINDVLDLSRIEAGKVAVNCADMMLAPVIEETLAMVHRQAESQHIELVLDASRAGEVCVNADRRLLKQVLLNLLSNAVKYSEDGSRVVVSVEESSDRVRLLVRDSGRGIAEDKLGQLFQPFNRLGAEGSSVPGTGMGLVIARHLAGLFKGQVGARPNRDVGMTFFLDIPKGEPAHCEVTLNEGSAEPLSTTTLASQSLIEGTICILYVEDTLSSIQVMQMLVDIYPGVVLHYETNAEAGMVWAREHRPDLILMDINLPGLDGIQAAQQLQADPEMGGTQIVLVSADAMEATRRRAANAGIERFIAKPFEIATMIALFDSVKKARAESVEKETV